MTGILLPDGLETIDNSFYGCDLLVTVDIPDSVTSITGIAFYHCDNLTTIVIPDGITELNGAFDRCSALTNVSLPESLTKIGGDTFANCTSLTSIIYRGTMAQFMNVELYGGNAYGHTWNGGCAAKEIICSDGKLIISGTKVTMP